VWNTFLEIEQKSSAWGPGRPLDSGGSRRRRIGLAHCVSIYTSFRLRPRGRTSKITPVTKTHELSADTTHSDAAPAASAGLRVGIDLAQISAIGASIERFGARFTARFFSAAEAAYAEQAPALAVQRFAARFAAKEAAIKAFGLAEEGISWRDIEVRRAPDGGCALALHGRVAALVERSGCTRIALSLSHDGDYATAMVVATAPT
jgi:holo-[acyl-carrier protein] synthase